MERSAELNLASLSLAWGRKFESVIKTHQRANIIVELEERSGKPKSLSHRFNEMNFQKLSMDRIKL